MNGFSQRYRNKCVWLLYFDSNYKPHVASRPFILFPKKSSRDEKYINGQFIQSNWWQLEVSSNDDICLYLLFSDASKNATYIEEHWKEYIKNHSRYFICKSKEIKEKLFIMRDEFKKQKNDTYMYSDFIRCYNNSDDTNELSLRILKQITNKTYMNDEVLICNPIFTIPESILFT